MEKHPEAAAEAAASALDRVPVVSTHAETAGEAAAPPAGPTGPLPPADDIREAIKEVIDPEIGINIVDLGLIYDIVPNDETGKVDVNMTLTSPGCPAGPEITSAVWMTVKRMTNVKDCEVNLVWKPRWDPTIHASEEARMFLGIW